LLRLKATFNVIINNSIISVVVVVICGRPAVGRISLRILPVHPSVRLSRTNSQLKTKTSISVNKFCYLKSVWIPLDSTATM